MPNDFERIYRKTMKPGYGGFLRGLLAGRAAVAGEIPRELEPDMAEGLRIAHELVIEWGDVDSALIVMDEILLKNFLEDQPKTNHVERNPSARATHYSVAPNTR